MQLVFSVSGLKKFLEQVMGYKTEKSQVGDTVLLMARSGSLYSFTVSGDKLAAIASVLDGEGLDARVEGDETVAVPALQLYKLARKVFKGEQFVTLEASPSSVVLRSDTARVRVDPVDAGGLLEMFEELLTVEGDSIAFTRAELLASYEGPAATIAPPGVEGDVVKIVLEKNATRTEYTVEGAVVERSYPVSVEVAPEGGLEFGVPTIYAEIFAKHAVDPVQVRLYGSDGVELVMANYRSQFGRHYYLISSVVV